MKVVRKLTGLIQASTITKSSTDFGRRVRGLTRGLWADEIDFFGFVDSLISAIYRGYEQAWQEGSAECGITPADRSSNERMILQREIGIAVERVMPFADFIQAHRKVDGFLLRTNLYRANLWSNRYNAVANLARSTSCADRKFVWVLGPTREHCNDCLTYAGRVHRGSVWESVGARPQSRSLACHGYLCQCRLEPTDAPASPGRPPRPTG
jgi:hypothetical protein